MRLVYSDSFEEVKVGDIVEIGRQPGSKVQCVVEYFAKPHKPESSGKVTIRCGDSTRVYYVSVIGAEWIEREDR